MNDTTPTTQGSIQGFLSPQELQMQVNAIQLAMKQVMIKDVHYGVIPGTKKPSLLKPGAEKICLMFRLITSFEIKRDDLPGNHREYTLICTLKDMEGRALGQGVGSCSTMEKKYRYRTGERLCPVCNKDAIIKGQEQYGGGWLCFKKKGGCGAKFDEEAKEIVSQQLGQIENPDIADVYNTILKMAKKRAHVDATITVTAAGDIFTQDVEDMDEFAGGVANEKPEPAQQSKRQEREVVDRETGEVHTQPTSVNWDEFPHRFKIPAATEKTRRFLISKGFIFRARVDADGAPTDDPGADDCWYGKILPAQLEAYKVDDDLPESFNQPRAN